MFLLLTTILLGITNITHALLKNYIIYSLAFLFITITSLIFHSCKKNNVTYCKTLLWYDQFAILCVFLVGCYYAFQISVTFFIMALLSISLCILLYCYGYLTNQFCWDPQNGTIYHGLMHTIGSLGHHAILLGLA